MTTIIVKKNNERYLSVECSGHTGFAEFGKDVLCASISSIIQSTALGIMKVADVKNLKITRRDKEGYFKFVIPENLNEKQLLSVDVLIKTLIVAVNDLQESYSEYVKLEER